jgi:hypothetical protein
MLGAVETPSGPRTDQEQEPAARFYLQVYISGSMFTDSEVFSINQHHRLKTTANQPFITV